MQSEKRAPQQQMSVSSSSTPYAVPLLARQAFSQLDARADRINNECDLQIEVGHRPIRTFNSDSVRLQLLHESFQILHFETDVVNRATFRWCGRHLRRQEIDFIAVEHRR